MRKIISILFLLTVLIPPAGPGLAQEGTPIPEEGILVQGFLFNRTTDEPGPDGIEVMLHAWDESGAARGMVHGVSGPGGAFEFEGVNVEQGVFYAVMAVYQGATNLSETFVADEDGRLPEIEVAIYETTTDTTNINIDLLHIVIGTGQGGLTVAEYYALSNQGDRTVVSSGALEQGREDTLVFTLPPHAANISFPSANPKRYRVFPGGFADSSGISPGVGTSQVVVTYVLPYEVGPLTIIRPVPFDVGEIKVFMPHQIELQLDVLDGTEEGVKMLGSNAEAYEVYALGPLQQGDPVELVVTGTLPSPSLPAGEDTIIINAGTRPSLLWGASILGVALITGGLWWWRRGEERSAGEEVLGPGESLDES
ncbi:MAG: hypothetical protein V3T55_09920 [Anaerolineales bacterium]